MIALRQVCCHPTLVKSETARRAQAGSATTDFATTNAIPLSLIGIGVGWLALSLRKQGAPDYGYEDDYYLGDEQYYGEEDAYMRDPAALSSGSTRERTGGLTQGARDMADNARGRAAGVADGARRLADSAREREDLSWEKWAERLQRYYSVIEALFSPDLIIVGGGVSKKADKFLPLLDLRAPIIPAQLRNQAGIIGAAWHAEHLG